MKGLKYTTKQCGSIFHVYDVIYRLNFYYIDCRTHEQYVKVLKSKLALEETSKKDTEGGFQVWKVKSIEVGVLWCPRKDHPILAHEVLHAVFWAMQKRQIELCYEAEEAFTYYHTFLMKAILGRL